MASGAKHQALTQPQSFEYPQRIWIRIICDPVEIAVEINPFGHGGFPNRWFDALEKDVELARQNRHRQGNAKGSPDPLVSTITVQASQPKALEPIDGPGKKLERVRGHLEAAPRTFRAFRAVEENPFDA